MVRKQSRATTDEPYALLIYSYQADNLDGFNEKALFIFADSDEDAKERSLEVLKKAKQRLLKKGAKLIDAQLSSNYPPMHDIAFWKQEELMNV